MLRKHSRFNFIFDPVYFEQPWPTAEEVANGPPHYRARPVPGTTPPPDRVSFEPTVRDNIYEAAQVATPVDSVLALVAGRSILGSQLPEGSFEELILGGIVCPQVDAANQIVYSILRPFELKIPSAHQGPSEHERIG